MKRTRNASRARIHLRVRKKIKGTPERPRLNVFRSNKAIYCQIIDDLKGHTLAAADSWEQKDFSGNKTEMAKQVGKALASESGRHHNCGVRPGRIPVPRTRKSPG